MTNFQFFVERCEGSRHFFCQIVTNNRTFILIEDDLPKLLSVDESKIHVFIGAWHTRIGRYNYYVLIMPDSVLKNEPQYGLTKMYMTSEDLFSISVFKNEMFYMLLEAGVEPEIIDAMTVHLKKNDTTKNKTSAYREPSKIFSVASAEELPRGGNEFWRGLIDRLSKMLPADRKLFAQLHGEIIGVLGDPHSSDVHAWDDVALDIMKIAREGGGAEDVHRYLQPYGWFYDDPQRDIQFAKKREELAQKLVEMITEGERK